MSAKPGLSPRSFVLEGAVPGFCGAKHQSFMARKHLGQPPMTLGTVPSLLHYTGKKGLNWCHSSMLNSYNSFLLKVSCPREPSIGSRVFQLSSGAVQNRRQ